VLLKTRRRPATYVCACSAGELEARHQLAAVYLFRQREDPIRPIVLAVCVCAAACSGQNLDSSTSHRSAALTPAQTQAQGGSELPFRGSFTSTGSSVTDCPPTCPPTTLTITGNNEGTATLLGRFTATSVDNVDLVTDTATGTLNFVAANGDQLFTTTTGVETEFIPPNISKPTFSAEIVGGTGRLGGATGTFTMRLVVAIDFAAQAHTGTGSFEGHINLNK
jgi:hypothetical protein